MPHTSKLAAKRIRETGGPTLLDFGAIADGEMPIRSGTTMVGTRMVSAEVMVSPQFNRLPAEDPNNLVRWDNAQAWFMAREAARPAPDPNLVVRWDDAQHVLAARIFGG